MPTRLFWKFFLVNAAINAAAMAGMAWIGRHSEGFLSRVIPFALIFFPLQLIVTWMLVSRASKPLDRVAKAAARLANGNYDEPVFVNVRDEFRDLANQLNSIRSSMASRDSEMQRLSTVLTAMTDGVIALDSEQRVQFANAAAGTLLGFKPDEIHGRKLLQAVRNNQLQEMVVRLLASQRSEEIEIKFGDENLRNLLVHATSFEDGEQAKPFSVVMMIYNLSEVRRLDAMRRDFVANVSHELKTPLSSIKAYAETLSAGAIHDEDNRDRFVNQIEEQADRLHQLISDLLSLARIEQGNQLLDIQRVSLAQVVEECVEEQQRSAEIKQIDLSIEPSEETVWVQVDKDGLRQILVNLVDNAIKYTPEGGRVIVSWRQEMGKIALEVSDSGIGIPESMRDRVFERFFRVDKARSRELGGTGLGLAIVKHLAQSFGGNVSVESELGEGSRFIVELPQT